CVISRKVIKKSEEVHFQEEGGGGRSSSSTSSRSGRTKTNKYQRRVSDAKLSKDLFTPLLLLIATVTADFFPQILRAQHLGTPIRTCAYHPQGNSVLDRVRAQYNMACSTRFWRFWCPGPICTAVV
ncbi:unnamed protein product, partial [Ectocarpus sp. 4 AP-2014]